MSQANVYTSVSDQAWYTDKARISTGNTAVTYQVEAVQLTYVQPGNGIAANAESSWSAGNIYSNAMGVPADSRQDIYVGAGNKLTIAGANYAVLELGTASSAQSGVKGTGSF